MSQSPSGSENQFQPHDTDTQNIPHSGVNGHERPVFNFDGKSLQDALDSGALHIEYDHEGNPKVIVPDNIGDHVDPTQSERTEVHEPLVTPQKKRIGKRGIAAIVSGVVGVAVIGGLGAGRVMGGDDPSPERERTSFSPDSPEPIDNESEAPNSGEKTLGESIIEGAATPSTPEQVQYVIDNPVSKKDHPNPVDALLAIGARANIIMLSDPEAYSHEQVAAMYESIYDSTSPYYDETVASMEERRKVAAAGFSLYDGLENHVSIRPTTDIAQPSPEGVVINADILYGGNVKDVFGANPDTELDFNADFVLTDDGENWQIYAGNNNHQVGDIG